MYENIVEEIIDVDKKDHKLYNVILRDDKYKKINKCCIFFILFRIYQHGVEIKEKLVKCFVDIRYKRLTSDILFSKKKLFSMFTTREISDDIYFYYDVEDNSIKCYFEDEFFILKYL